MKILNKISLLILSILVSTNIVFAEDYNLDYPDNYLDSQKIVQETNNLLDDFNNSQTVLTEEEQSSIINLQRTYSEEINSKNKIKSDNQTLIRLQSEIKVLREENSKLDPKSSRAVANRDKIESRLNEANKIYNLSGAKNLDEVIKKSNEALKASENQVSLAKKQLEQQQSINDLQRQSLNTKLKLEEIAKKKEEISDKNSPEFKSLEAEEAKQKEIEAAQKRKREILELRKNCTDNCGDLDKQLEEVDLDFRAIQNQAIQDKTNAIAGQSISLSNFGIVIGNVRSLEDLVTNILRFLTRMAGVIMILVIMLAGVRMMTNAGDESAIDESKKMIKNTIIAAVFIFGAYVIVTGVMQVLYSFGS